MICVSIIICLLLKPCVVTRDRNWLRHKKKIYWLRSFSPRACHQAKSKSHPGFRHSWIQSPGNVTRTRVSPFGSAAAHMEGRCRQQPQAPVPLSPQPGRTVVRSRTTELGLGSYSWELAPCPEKGELNSEFGRFAFPRGRAQEPSWLEGISLTLLGTSSTLKLTTTGPIKAALFQQDRPHQSGKRWPWALATGPCSLLPPSLAQMFLALACISEIR